MKKLFSVAVFAVLALALSLGQARALSVTMAPPPNNPGGAIACPASATIVAGTNNLWTVTDAQCVRSNLSNGWTVVQTPQALTPAANVVMDLSKGCSATIAFPIAGQNVTLTATNIAFCVGKPVVVYTTQPASGTTTNTLTFSTGFTANAAFPAVKTGTSATDAVAFADNGTALMYPLSGSSSGGGSSTTPSYTSVTVTGSADETVLASNGGHINSLLGTGTVVTVASCGTGAVTSGATDNAGEVTATGATSCQVVFGVSFHATPICVASDETTAAALTVSGLSAAHFSVGGLTSGDKFMFVCVGK